MEKENALTGICYEIVELMREHFEFQDKRITELSLQVIEQQRIINELRQWRTK